MASPAGAIGVERIEKIQPGDDWGSRKSSLKTKTSSPPRPAAADQHSQSSLVAAGEVGSSNDQSCITTSSWQLPQNLRAALGQVRGTARLQGGGRYQRVSFLLGVALEGEEVVHLSHEAIVQEFLFRLAAAVDWVPLEGEGQEEALLNRVDSYVTKVCNGRMMEVASLQDGEKALQSYLDDPHSDNWDQLKDMTTGLIQREEAILCLLLYYWYIYLIPRPAALQFRDTPVDTASTPQASLLSEFCVPARHAALLTLSPLTARPGLSSCHLDDSAYISSLRACLVNGLGGHGMMAQGITWIDIILDHHSYKSTWFSLEGLRRLRFASPGLPTLLVELIDHVGMGLMAFGHQEDHQQTPMVDQTLDDKGEAEQEEGGFEEEVRAKMTALAKALNNMSQVARATGGQEALMQAMKGLEMMEEGSKKIAAVAAIAQQRGRRASDAQQQKQPPSAKLRAHKVIEEAPLYYHDNLMDC